LTGTPVYQRFLAEFKRRGVFRAAALYGTAAFVTIEASDLVLPRLAVPEWTVTLVVWVALIGFPIALVLAWTYEKTPEGLKATDPAETAELEAIVAQPARRRWPAGLAALVGIVLLGLGAWWTLTRTGPGAQTYDSIAVLPFADLSGNPDNQYFSDGLADELINALAGVEDLEVAGRTSTFALRDQSLDLRTIGDTLGVETVLEGSVRRSEERVRITAQLIDAETGFQLWSEEYDRDITDIFQVQEELAASIVGALAPRLRGEGEELYRGGTSDVQAYDLYLAGRQKWVTRRVPELREAVEDFETAIARDSSFALAWSGLADAIDALAYRDGSGVPLIPRAKQAALRSILLDPEMAEGWASLGVLAHEIDRDWTSAELALKRALELKPSYTTARQWLGDMLRSRGRVNEAHEHQSMALMRDPLSPVINASNGFTLLILGRREEARELYERTLEIGGDLTTAYARLVMWGPEMGLSAVELEKYAEGLARVRGAADPSVARVIGRAVAAPSSDRAVRDSALAVVAELTEAEVLTVPRRVAGIYAVLGDHDTAIEWLIASAASGDPTMVIAGVDPALDPLRDDPRMQALMDELGLPNGYDPAADTYKPEG
jgi:TolB-like protein